MTSHEITHNCTVRHCLLMMQSVFACRDHSYIRKIQLMLSIISGEFRTPIGPHLDNLLSEFWRSCNVCFPHPLDGLEPSLVFLFACPAHGSELPFSGRFFHCTIDPKSFCAMKGWGQDWTKPQPQVARRLTETWDFLHAQASHPGARQVQSQAFEPHLFTHA